MPVRANERASLVPFPYLTEEIAVVLGGLWLYEVDVCEFVLAELLDDVGELGLWICHAHTYARSRSKITSLVKGIQRTLERAPRTKPDARPFCTNGLHDGIYNLEHKSCAILDTPAIFVRALVGDILNELVEEIAIRAVNFNAIKACSDGISCSGDVGGNVLLDLILGKGARHFSFWPSREVNRRSRNIRTIVLFGKNVRVRGAANCPELEVNERTLLVNCICYL